MWVGGCFSRGRDEGGCWVPYGDGGEDEDGLVERGKVEDGVGRRVEGLQTVLTCKGADAKLPS